MAVFDRVVGVIYLETENPQVRFDEGHLRLSVVIAGIAAMAIENLRYVERLESENVRLQAQVGIAGDMVGESTRMREVYRVVSKVAATNSTVLILGDRHRQGAGRSCDPAEQSAGSQPFVAINCAATAETLLESELFGHEKGAFTGAIALARRLVHALLYGAPVAP